MIGEVTKRGTMPGTLRALHDVSNGRLEIMSLMYDLDGALDAEQVGMARYTAISLLDAAVAQWLRERAISAPTFPHIAARARVGLSLLAGVNPALAAHVDTLYNAAIPVQASAVAAYCHDVIAVVAKLSGYGSAGLGAAVSGWAESAQAVRAVCERLGVPVNDFYWAPPDAETWHSDVMRFAATQTSFGEGHGR
jgi:hypothetical protein